MIRCGRRGLSRLHGLSVGALLACCCLPAWGRTEPSDDPAPKSRAMASELATLRTEVHELDAAIRSVRSQSAMMLKSLQGRLGELEAAEDAERIRVKGLEAELKDLRDAVSQQGDGTESLRRAVHDAVSRLEQVVRAGLPFKLDERVAALSRIRDELAGGRIDPADAASRIWRFVEDEQRLASTVEQAEIPLQLAPHGPATLVQAVRVGTVALFTYRAPDRWGRVVRDTTGGFSYRDVTQGSQIQEIQRLFQSVGKQIREGRYRLPLLGAGVRVR